MSSNNIIRNQENFVCILYWCFDLFNIAFFKLQQVPAPVLSFENNRNKSLGHYPVAGNAHSDGMPVTIYRINPQKDLGEILATILHCMVHSWQNRYGKPSQSWFHNKEFRLKMHDCGILCNPKGCHLGIKDPFLSILNNQGIPINQSAEENGIIKLMPESAKKGNSKLKKWSCGCTNVRVGVKEVRIRCLKCRNEFELIG